MFYVYMLINQKNRESYIGSTNDLRRRLQEHNHGLEISTKRYMPWELIYYEAYKTETLARNREAKLKQHGNAKRELKLRAGLLRSVNKCSPSTTPVRKSGAGFTLIELLIVIGIIAILTTIGVPNYLNLRNKSRLEVSTQLLVGELNYTMERSGSQEDGNGDGNGDQWWVHLDNPAVGDFYTVCYGTYTASAASCALEGGTEFKRAVLGAGVEFDSSLGLNKDVVFSKATGLPTATTVVIINSTTGAGSKTVTVNLNGSIAF